MYHWDVLVTYQWDVVGCFIWELFVTSRRRTDETSLLRPFEAPSQRSNRMSWRHTIETSWRRSIETLLGVSFETYLQRHWGVQKDVITTSSRRLAARWDVLKNFAKFTEDYVCWNLFFNKVEDWKLEKCGWFFLKFKYIF